MEWRDDATKRRRILTTNVGSLARPKELLDTMRAKAGGEDYDPALLEQQVHAAVADVVQRQAAAGIDVASDGEQGKVGFFTAVLERLEGFSATEGESAIPASWQKEISAFPRYYDRYVNDYFSHNVTVMRSMYCVGPVSYQGQAAIRRDIANLQQALDGVEVAEAFLPSTAPYGFGINRYYGSEEDYLVAVADAVREEYQAIVDAGLLLQVDDPWLIEILSGDGAEGPEARRRAAEQHLELINYALRGIPQERVRVHTCYGLNHGPRIHDVPMREVAELVVGINAGAYSFEIANPRHLHEWRIWEDVQLPEGRVLIPGMLSHAINFVEHPELIAEYLQRYAALVGKEHVIAGADCGFSSQATYRPEVDPDVVWTKFAALAEGARLASDRLWGAA